MVAAPHIIHLVMELLERHRIMVALHIIHLAMELQELPATMVETLLTILQIMEQQEAHQIMVVVQVILLSVVVTQGVQAIMVVVQPLMTMIRFLEPPATMAETLHIIQLSQKRSPQVSGMTNRFNN